MCRFQMLSLATLGMVILPQRTLSMFLSRSQGSYCPRMLWQLQQYTDAELLEACEATLLDSQDACLEAEHALAQRGRPWKASSVFAACRTLSKAWFERQQDAPAQATLALMARRAERTKHGARKNHLSAQQAVEWTLLDKVTHVSSYDHAPTEPLPPYPTKDNATDGTDRNLDDEDYVEGMTFTFTTTTTTAVVNGSNSTGSNNATNSTNASHANATNSTKPPSSGSPANTTKPPGQPVNTTTAPPTTAPTPSSTTPAAPTAPR